MSRKIVLIGAGAFGVRHLEGLLRTKTPLSITVIDHSMEALQKAKLIPNKLHHRISFKHEIPPLKQVDIAIVATTSAHRAIAIRELLSKTKRVRYLVLEKILFGDKKDYALIGNLIKKHGVKTWVNHSRRLFPFHRSLARQIGKKPFLYHIRSGNRNGLMANATHYADYCSLLAGSTSFQTDTSLLSPKYTKSKRMGFLELYGTLIFRFVNGSIGMATSLPQTAPLKATLESSSLRVAFDETAGKAFIAKKHERWRWNEKKAPFLLQSEMTGPLIERILHTGKCELPDYATAAKVHLQVLEPVRRFLSLSSFPFT